MPNRAIIATTLIAASLLAGCGSRAYDRVVVIGLLVPVKEEVPAPGERRQALPPMEAMPIQPDTADGNVIVAVDQNQFFRDHGTTMPAYAKPTSRQQTDRNLDDFRKLVEDLAAVRSLLDQVFGAMETDFAAAKSGQPQPNRSAALILKPGDWTTLVTRVMQVTISVDHLVAQSREPGPDGRPVEGLDGEAAHQRLANELWQGMEQSAQVLLLDSENLATGGALEDLRNHPTHGAEIEKLLAAVRTQAKTVSAIVHARHAPDVVPHVRLLQQRVDELEASPLCALAFGLPKPGEVPINRHQRDDARLRLARLRKDLVALAAQWTTNNARMLDPQPVPTVVYRPAATMD